MPKQGESEFTPGCNSRHDTLIFSAIHIENFVKETMRKSKKAPLDMVLHKWQSTCSSMLETVATHLLGPWPLTHSQQTTSALPVMIIPAAS